ncbi:hypothetical protein EES41_36225 [Streptomyces sp. ADI95-16]|nr:hypothetical protein EES41_36225 [Streptomyces sp. ADI95-16]
MLLAGLAEKADSDGCNAFPSRRTLARIALCDVKTVQRRLASLVEQGVIVLGDQDVARYIPKQARPKVYDLQIPAAWYGPERLARVNQDRAHRGLPPLTNDNRAPLPPAPPRAQRSDKGKPRPGGGDSQSPPPGHPDPDGRGDCQSPGRGDSVSLQGGLTVPQPSPLTLPVTETPVAPTARSADDARRAGAGSSVREAGGSAAPADADAPALRSGRGASASHRIPPALADAIRAVEAAWPRELAALLPDHRPSVLREAILQALDGGRTAHQLVQRIQRRWWTHGYARALAEGQLASPVGVAVALVRPSTDCPDPMCEDGVTLHLGDGCPKCEQRRTDRRRGQVPGSREKEPAPHWWECDGQGCTAAGKGPRPADGLCWQCQERVEQAAAQTAVQRVSATLAAEAQAAGEAARLRQTIRWARMLDEAYAEHAERSKTAQERTEAQRKAAADAAQVRMLREQLLREHPELGAYAQEQT